jgi:hypothetical protein
VNVMKFCQRNDKDSHKHQDYDKFEDNGQSFEQPVFIEFVCDIDTVELNILFEKEFTLIVWSDLGPLPYEFFNKLIDLGSVLATAIE